MANSNFYDELDLRYPEIAICIDRIDRTNPGIKNFYIPILTPNLDVTSLEKRVETVHVDKSCIANAGGLNVSNVKIQNYIPIVVPRHLCTFVGGDYHIKEVGDIEFKSDGEHHISGSGTVGPPLEYNMLDATGHLKYDGDFHHFHGIVNLMPTDDFRYIEKGSKWIVVFIGGDIGKPQLVGRYFDEGKIDEVPKSKCTCKE